MGDRSYRTPVYNQGGYPVNPGASYQHPQQRGGNYQGYYQGGQPQQQQAYHIPQPQQTRQPHTQSNQKHAQQLAKLQRYLGQVLSQRGREALPYQENEKYVVRQHVLDIVSEFPSLSVTATTYTHNDGSNVNILKLEGTAPMYFQGRKYNLPLTLWLLEGYPRTPPCVYLTPTSDMIIKSNHAFVDPSGCVTSPYLEEWTFPSSNLRDLTTTLCIHFGQDPPLYAKPPNWRPAVHAAQAATGRPIQGSGYPGSGQMQANAYPGSNSGNTAAAANASFHAYNPIVSQHPQPGQQPGTNMNMNPHQPGGASHVHSHANPGGNSAATNNSSISARDQGGVVSKDPPMVVFKEYAADALARRVLKTFQAIERHTTQSVEDRLGEQQVLEERSSKLTVVSQALAKERDMIDECIHKYESKTLELEDWLSKHREIDKDINADLDAVFIPSDPLSAQAIEVIAKDMAIEDALYSLEQALLNDALDPEVYLKQVRSLCRKQFYHRKLCMKIADVQKEQQALQPPRPRTLSKDNNGDLGEWEILQDMNLNKK